MNTLYKVSFSNNTATVASGEGFESAFASLEALKQASKIRFAEKANLHEVASQLKTRALKEISGWTKFWDGIGSILLSCFGFKTSVQKLESIFDEVERKEFQVDDSTDNKSPPKESTKPSSPHTPQELKRKREEEARRSEADELARKAALNEANRAADIERKRVEEIKKEAKEFIDSLQLALIATNLKDAKDYLEDLLKAFPDEKRQACFEYGASIDHYEIAVWSLSHLPEEKRRELSERYGIFITDEIANILQNVAEFQDFVKNEKYEEARAFINGLSLAEGVKKFCSLLIDYHALFALIKNKDYESAIEAINALRFSDLRKEVVVKLASELFNKESKSTYVKEGSSEVRKYIETLEKGLARDGAIISFISRVGDFEEALSFANAIEYGPLKSYIKEKYGLVEKEECERRLNLSAFASISKQIKQNDYIAALKLAQEFTDSKSLQRHLAVLGADYYIKLNDWARATEVIKDIPFYNLSESYRDLANKIPDHFKEKSKLFYEIDSCKDNSYFFYSASRAIEKASDADLKDEGYEYIVEFIENYNKARESALKIQNEKRREAVLSRFGLISKDDLRKLPQYKELKQKIREGVQIAGAYAESLNSPSFELAFKINAAKRLIQLGEFNKAKLVAETIKFKDLREDLVAKIDAEEKSRERKLQDFLQSLKKELLAEDDKQAIKLVEKEKKPAFINAGCELIIKVSSNYEMALRALSLLQNREFKQRLQGEACLFKMDEMKSDELTALPALLDEKRFDEARDLIVKAKIDSAWLPSLRLHITHHEIVSFIDQGKEGEALNLIQTVPYRSMQKKYRFDLEMALARTQFPHLSKAAEKRGEIPDTQIYQKLINEISNIDQLFIGVEGVKIDYCLSLIVDEYLKNKDLESAKRVAFLALAYDSYDLKKVARAYLEVADVRGIELADYLEDGVFFKERALIDCYFTNVGLRDALIKSFKHDLNRTYGEIVQNCVNRKEAEKLLQKIDPDSYANYSARIAIAVNFADFKLLVDSAIGHYFFIFQSADFIKKFDPAKVQYTEAELGEIEEKIDTLQDWKKKSKIELYELLAQISPNDESKKRIAAKIKELT